MLIRHRGGYGSAKNPLYVEDFDISNTNLLVKMSNGLIYGAGANDTNQLMTGNGPGADSPVLVRANELIPYIEQYGGIKQIAAGTSVVQFLYNDDAGSVCPVTVVGANLEGQVSGSASSHTTAEPFYFRNVEGGVRLIKNEYHATFVSYMSGMNIAVGRNASGGLGIGHRSNIINYASCVYAGTTHGAFGNRTIKKVSGGFESLQILCEDNTMWACGFQDTGQLGYADGGWRTAVTEALLYGTLLFDDISQGNNTMITFARQGNMWLACGSYRTLDIIPFNVPTAQIGNATYARYSRPLLPCVDIEYPDVQEVSTQFFTSIYRKQDGTLWGCGSGELGQLGNGTLDYGVNGRVTTTRVLIPANEFVVRVKCGDHLGAALCESGNLYAWGYSTRFQLGTGSTNPANPVPQKVLLPRA